MVIANTMKFGFLYNGIKRQVNCKLKRERDGYVIFNISIDSDSKYHEIWFFVQWNKENRAVFGFKPFQAQCT